MSSSDISDASGGPEISAIVLCYRAEEGIVRVLEPLWEDLRSRGETFELVLVANYDQEESDRTPDIVRRFAEGRSGVTVVARRKEGAMGWDMRSGLAAALGKYLVVIDGDEQNPVEDVTRAYVELKRSGADVLKGRRIARFDGYYRHFVSVVYNVVFKMLFRTRGLWDINGKPKALTRSAYERMNLTSDDWFVDAEIILEAKRIGLQVVEIPVVFRQNEGRSSFVRASAIWEFLRNMTRSLRHRKG